MRFSQSLRSMTSVGLCFPPRARAADADVTHVGRFFGRSRVHRMTPAYGAACNRVRARLNSILGASQGPPGPARNVREALTWALGGLPAYLPALLSIHFQISAGAVVLLAVPVRQSRAQRAPRPSLLFVFDVFVAVCLAELGSVRPAAAAVRPVNARNHAALALYVNASRYPPPARDWIVCRWPEAVAFFRT